jgi:hypothetical protein
VFKQIIYDARPIEQGGARPDPANMMAVCKPHHSAIHRGNAAS